MIRKSGGRPPPTSLARRHFMGVIAAGTSRLSTIAISASLIAGVKVKDANALGKFPIGAPRTGGANCFKRGTFILTAQGEVPVEDLANGALVITPNGALPVKWIGRKSLSRNASASWHRSVVPIRVSRFAIDDQTPRRDLYISQAHCLLIDGVFIPVKHLVNGRSITFNDEAKGCETIEYFSVELDAHEVIFAEGTAVETFRYVGGQIAWDNLGDYQDLYGEHKVMPAFAPICRYAGGRAEVRALLRFAASRFIEVRDPVQIAYDRIAARAMTIAA
jgi:hypothetical protein